MRTTILKFAGSIGDSFRHVQGNSRAVLRMQPFWALAINLFVPYTTLFMLEVGCTSEEVGRINAIGMVTGTVIAVFAGWLTDRMGRRFANAFGDFFCWSLAPLLWGLSQNYMWFVAAACANSFMRLSGVAWNCSLNEGTPPEHRITIYWWLSIVQTLSAFATPLMSLLIKPLGLELSMRWVLLCSSGVLTITTIIRFNMMKELPIGRERREAARKESPLAALKAYVPMAKLILASPILLVYILLRVLYYVQMGIKGTFQPIAIVNGMGFANSIIGTLNVITGSVMLLAQFLLLPKLRLISTDRALAVSISTLLASMLILVFAPANSIVLLVLSTVLTAGGSVVTGMLVDTSLANALPDMQRAQLLSFVTVLTVALSAPFMWLGGILSGIPALGPRLPLALIALLFGVCLALLMAAGRIRKRRQPAELTSGSDSQEASA